MGIKGLQNNWTVSKPSSFEVDGAVTDWSV